MSTSSSDMALQCNEAQLVESTEAVASSEIAVSVRNLGKSYRLWNTPQDRLKQPLRSMFSRWLPIPHKQYFNEFWALRDISFDVKKGETIGIIGRNGSGKSTLLQVLCGTLAPTCGSYETRGRVSALLELGSGFNTEFSGHDNVYMNASILGLSKDEIDERYESIVEFADIGQFIDQPVKTYSSGMYVRLAFAVAISVEPDILVVDEALAVGDLSFQAKCMSKLRRLMNSGVAILFVSHDMSSVRNLCNRVLWLVDGRSSAYDEPESTIGKYISELHLSINKDLAARSETGIAAVSYKSAESKDRKNYPETFGPCYRRYGDGRAAILGASLTNSAGIPAEALRLHEEFLICFAIRANVDIPNPAVGFSFRDLKGNQVIGSLTTNYGSIQVPAMRAGAEYLVEIRGTNRLGQGPYTVNLGLENVIDTNMVHEFVDVVENAIVFRSIFGGDQVNIFPAMVWQDVTFSLGQISQGSSERATTNYKTG